MDTLNKSLEKMQDDISLADAKRMLFFMLSKTDFKDSTKETKEKAFTLVYHLLEVLKE